MVDQLGRLESVDPRSVWPDEARDFTPWLFANADVLADALGVDVEMTAREYLVGGYSLDLLGRDITNDCVMIVENQLGHSDHTHLGQVLTYAAGTDASTIVWVAPRFRQEHLSAVTWLNDRTDEDTRVFAVELGLRRIGDSAPAPFLDVVGKPNDWHKEVKAASARSGADSELQQSYLRFWGRYVDEVRERHPEWRAAEPRSRNYLNQSLPVRGSALVAAFVWDGKVGVRMWIDSGDPELNREIFSAIRGHEVEFGSQFEDEVVWDDREDRRACDISVYRPGSIADTDRQNEYLEWMIATGERFRVALERVDLPAHLRS